MEPLLFSGTGDVALNKTNCLVFIGFHSRGGKNNKDKDTVSGSDREGGLSVTGTLFDLAW